jgi:hypothetical protein
MMDSTPYPLTRKEDSIMLGAGPEQVASLVALTRLSVHPKDVDLFMVELLLTEMRLRWRSGLVRRVVVVASMRA